jgi:hypothetical protein
MVHWVQTIVPHRSFDKRARPVLSLRRYTRLTNAFSRKIEDRSAAVARYYFAYNFIKIHGTATLHAAMAARATDRLWEVSDLIALLEATNGF